MRSSYKSVNRKPLRKTRKYTKLRGGQNHSHYIPIKDIQEKKRTQKEQPLSSKQLESKLQNLNLNQIEILKQILSINNDFNKLNIGNYTNEKLNNLKKKYRLC